MRGALVTCLTLLSLTACGGAPVDHSSSHRNIAEILATPVNSKDQSAEHSRKIEKALEAQAFHGMSRLQVEQAIGKGDPCSRHPRCEEQGFNPDDWFYDGGTMGEGSVQLPSFILGFDHQGRVNATWNLRTH